MINRFVLNEVSYFGPGAREVLPQEIKRLGLHKAFVATDKDLIKFGVADKVLKVLENAGIPYEIFSEIKPNPTVSNVKAGVEAFAKSGADFILAIGGGSSIDTSKAIGIITNNPDFSDVVSLVYLAVVSVLHFCLFPLFGLYLSLQISYILLQTLILCFQPLDLAAAQKRTYPVRYGCGCVHRRPLHLLHVDFSLDLFQFLLCFLFQPQQGFYVLLQTVLLLYQLLVVLHGGDVFCQ